MNRVLIIEAAQWEARLVELRKALEEHKNTCKHWAFVGPFPEMHSDPQFPPYTRYKCEFCGRVMDEHSDERLAAVKYVCDAKVMNIEKKK